MHILKSFACILAGVATASCLSKRAAQPLPLSVSGRWIVDATGAHVPYVGVNWPGAEETMLPEGLQYQSVADIVKIVTNLGFNSVRLTFAIEMVDQIFDNGGKDVPIQTALVNALGQANGTAVFGKILAKNPSFTASTTRLQVWDAVAQELGRQGVYVHLDNHVSKAMWCCGLFDGNAWFGDEYFDTSKWIRGHGYMASHGKANWPTFASVGLRNELRPSGLTNITTLQPYTWSVWKEYMTAAAAAVHAANPDVLIFFSGQLSDYDLTAPVAGTTSKDPNFTFSITELPYANKFVFEQHQYDSYVSFSNGPYENYAGAVDSFNGRVAVLGETVANSAPLVMTEWGHDQTDASGSYLSNYRVYFQRYTGQRQIGWMVWVLAGSYYIREGQQDVAESYGLVDKTWSNFQGKLSLAALRGFISDTYAVFNLTGPGTGGSNSTVTATGTASTAATAIGSSAASAAGTASGTAPSTATGIASTAVTGTASDTAVNTATGIASTAATGTASGTAAATASGSVTVIIPPIVTTRISVPNENGSLSATLPATPPGSNATATGIYPTGNVSVTLTPTLQSTILATTGPGASATTSAPPPSEGALGFATVWRTGVFCLTIAFYWGVA